MLISFVVHDVSMVIHHGRFTSGNSGHTYQNGLTVGKGPFNSKRPSVTTAIMFLTGAHLVS